MLRGAAGMRTPKRSKLDPLDEIAAAFDEGMDRVDELSKKVGTMATMDAVRGIQDEMRKYAEERDQQQSDALTERMDLINGNLRQGIMADVSKLLQENLSGWVEKSLQPMVDELITAREEAAKLERDRQIDRLKNRAYFVAALLSLATAGVVLYSSFQGTATQKEVRALDRIDDSLNSFVQ